MTKNPTPSFINTVPGQLGYFLSVPQSFAFAADAGSGRQESYFSIANTTAVEGLSELWVGVQP
jgi:hypothetical protein